MPGKNKEQAVEARPNQQGLNPTYEELIQEIQGIDPRVLEIAALRVQNRKLQAALEVSETDEDGSDGPA